MNRAFRNHARERVEELSVASPLFPRPRRWAVWCIFTALLVGAGRAGEAKFDFAALQHRAQELAAESYRPAAKDRVPEWLRTLSYDDYRLIEFDPAHSLWRSEHLPFQVQFFHPGQLFNRVVGIAEIRDGRVEPIAFRRELFNYHQLKVGALPASLGFAGFRLLYPLTGPNDELGAFLGASYFRFLGA
jgi:glucans biosynthesis protein